MFKVIIFSLVSLGIMKFAQCSQPALEFGLDSALSLPKICKAAEKSRQSRQCSEQLTESCRNKSDLRLRKYFIPIYNTLKLILRCSDEESRLVQISLVYLFD